jgi:hypothetical protein
VKQEKLDILFKKERKAELKIFLLCPWERNQSNVQES